MTPFVFFSLSLPVILRQAGVPLELIGLTALVYVPAAFSFFWASLVENRLRAARRAHLDWVLMPFAAMAIVSALLSFTPPSSSFSGIFFLIMSISVLSATGRIALMGYSVAAFAEHEHALASVAMLSGSAVASLLGAGGLLYAYSVWGWSVAILGVAAIATIGAALAAAAPKANPLETDTKPKDQTRASLRHVWRRPGSGRLMILLVFLGVGVGLGFGMVQPLLVEQGYSNEQIALVNATITFGALLLGGPLSAMSIRQFGLTSTLIFGLLICIGVFLLAAYLTFFRPGIASGAIIVGLVFLTFSFLSVASTTFFMKVSNQGQESTDLSLIQSLYLLMSLIGAAFSGLVAGQLGFWASFAAAAVFTAFAMGAFLAVLRVHAQVAEIETAQT